MAEKSPFFRNFASHILPVLTFATLLVGTALVGVALTRIPQRPTDAAPPSPTPETSYIAAGSLTGRTILVDPGHGGYDGGARCRDSGVWEKEVNLAVALAVEKSLTQRGATVLMTRRTDTDLCDDTTRPANVTKKRQDMQCRVDMAVQGQADMVLSIHMNEYRVRSESGPQVLPRGQRRGASARRNDAGSAHYRPFAPKGARRHAGRLLHSSAGYAIGAGGMRLHFQSGGGSAAALACLSGEAGRSDCRWRSGVFPLGTGRKMKVAFFRRAW